MCAARRSATKARVRAFFASADEVKTVRVAITGDVDFRSAAIDEVTILLEHDIPVSGGGHDLWWSVRGPNGTKYKVALSGAAKWEHDFSIKSRDEDFGSKPFKIE